MPGDLDEFGLSDAGRIAKNAHKRNGTIFSADIQEVIVVARPDDTFREVATRTILQLSNSDSRATNRPRRRTRHLNSWQMVVVYGYLYHLLAAGVKQIGASPVYGTSVALKRCRAKLDLPAPIGPNEHDRYFEGEVDWRTQPWARGICGLLGTGGARMIHRSVNHLSATARVRLSGKAQIRLSPPPGE